MSTKLSDLIIPEKWAPYAAVATTEQTRFIQSGIMSDLSSVLASAMGGGTTINLPFLDDLDGDDEIVDDRYDLTVGKVESGQDVGVTLFRAKVFGASDLSAEMTGADPMLQIANRFGDYWARRIQRIALETVKGVMGTTKVGGSMAANTLDITGLSGAAGVFDGYSFIDACGRLGDHEENLSGIAVHSDTYRLMKKQDLIDFIKDSEGRDIATYMGKQVTVDDSMPKITAGSPPSTTYDSYIFGPGALGFAQADPSDSPAAEVDREPLKGGGREYIVNRRRFLCHVRGVKWEPASGVPAKATPSNAELGNSGNWTRVWDPKLVRIVRFRHRLA